MKKGLEKWVIDIVPPRKTEVSVELVAMVGDFVSESLELVLNSDSDPVGELVRAGAVVNKFKIRSPKFKVDQYKYKPQHDFENIIAQIRAPMTDLAVVSSLVKQPEPRVIGYIKSEHVVPDSSFHIPKFSRLRNLRFNFSRKKNYWKLSIFLLGISGVLIYGLGLKNEIVRNSGLALYDIKEAQVNLEKFNFDEAAGNFNKSHDNFSQAGRNLNFLGAGLVGILGDVPGTSKLKSAKKIVEAGKLLTSSGQSISEALALLSRTGSVLNPNETNKVKPSRIVGQLKSALGMSNKNLNKVTALLLDVDDSVIPQDKRKDFIDFKEKLPIIERLISDAYKYTDFLERVIGVDEHKKYLILFNNYSELRPTGGFPGTYGVISFSNGGLENLFVDDVYNLDGQLKRKIAPPKQLRHITSTWGMRDAAWFIDFPASTRKIMEFFIEEAGYEVDGVIALNPDIISHILKVVGPIEMPEYGMILTADNFLANIQEEVEYGENRTQPKTIIVDFMPRLLERLYSANSEKWMDIFSRLITSLKEKDMIFYFDDKELEKFVIEEGFGGEVKKVNSDYLAVNFSNIKGSKTDAVTDSSINIEARPENNRVIHKVVITRNHKGGNHEYGFYNRQNPAYVRVLIPKDADLLNVSGNDLPQYYPLVDYQNYDFEKDKDLAKFESGFYFDKSKGVDRFEESDKNGIGFWMITDAGDTKTAVLEYSVPLQGGEYSFYFQKQPGLDWKNFRFKWNGSNLVNGELKKDLEIPIKLR